MTERPIMPNEPERFQLVWTAGLRESVEMAIARAVLAGEQKVSVSEWVREACREKLERER